MFEKQHKSGGTFHLKVIFLIIATQLMYASFWMASTFFQIIKWLLAPFVLVGQLLFLWPFATIKTSFPHKVDVKKVSENDLASDVWQLLQEQKDQLHSKGFVGKDELLSVELFEENALNYIYPMVNESSKIGVGLNYAMLKDKNGEYSILDMAFIEFTVISPEGDIIDFHNNGKDILQSFDNRRRYYFRENDPARFYKIVEVISQKTGCTSSQRSIDLLKNNPSILFQEEAEIGFQAMEENNIIYSSHGKRRLRWLGALKVIAHSFWPMSAWCEYRKYKNTLRYLKNIDINIETIPYYDEEISAECAYNNPITTLPELQKNLKDPEYQFGFSSEHKIVSVMFDLNDSLTVENIVVKMQEVIHFYAKNRIKLSQYEVEFVNSELLCKYDGYGSAIYDAELYEIEEPLSDLNQFISVQQVVDIAHKKMNIEQPDDASLTLTAKDKRMIWEVYFQKNEIYQIIKIDALSGDVFFEGGKEDLYTSQ